MTSNIGARLIEKSTPLGFHKSHSTDVYAKIKENVFTELKKTFNPEFLNRVDDIVVFHPLEESHLLAILDLLISETNKKLAEYGMVITVSDEVKHWILNKYYQPVYGARPMRRAIAKEIEDPLSEEILRGRFKGSSLIKVELKNNNIEFEEVDEEVTASIN